MSTTRPNTRQVVEIRQFLEGATFCTGVESHFMMTVLVASGRLRSLRQIGLPAAVDGSSPPCRRTCWPGGFGRSVSTAAAETLDFVIATKQHFRRRLGAINRTVRSWRVVVNDRSWRQHSSGQGRPWTPSYYTGLHGQTDCPVSSRRIC